MGNAIWISVALFCSAFLVFVLLAGVGFLIKEWMDNNKLPVSTVQATVKAMRKKSSKSGTTRYYATFEIEAESREWQISSVAYSEIDNGDQGTLSFQGTRFKAFEKK